ncbi:hypothetical protein EJP82_12000 [Paenibacillus anaericanus]|uniref:Nucleotidyltransferase family protein n=1 Tax=Paenibacillus anaericanus TaxID=170367 RepID=A0A433Y9G0_9BACL|nr:hypothetical protein [Paenibacillus anaericanus]RUT46564.1 hypothetical protein EJP82_12000 [Paenibacillus anaericanus]
MNHYTLFPIIKRLEENSIVYSLGGSGLLYYLNLIDSINDWDITVECPKDKLIETLEGYDWVEQRSGDYPFASQYRLSIASLNIDFIGCFALHTENGVLNLPINHNRKWDGINISSPEVWYVAYYLMNRKPKASMLLNYLKTSTEKVNTTLINDLIKTNILNNELSQELSLLIR